MRDFQWEAFQLKSIPESDFDLFIFEIRSLPVRKSDIEIKNIFLDESRLHHNKRLSDSGISHNDESRPAPIQYQSNIDFGAVIRIEIEEENFFSGWLRCRGEHSLGMIAKCFPLRKICFIEKALFMELLLPSVLLGVASTYLVVNRVSRIFGISHQWSSLILHPQFWGDSNKSSCSENAWNMHACCHKTLKLSYLILCKFIAFDRTQNTTQIPIDMAIVIKVYYHVALKCRRHVITNLNAY